LKAWLPDNDLAHFVVAAVERVAIGTCAVPRRTGGKAQYNPRLMLALLIYSYANGIFSSRRIERATYRDIAVRFVAANLHPDHDTIAVSIDGTKIDANASKIRSLRYDRAKELRAKLAADIATLTAQAETADAQDHDSQALPAELARREALHAKLDAACTRLETQAKAQAEAERPAFETKKAAYDAKKGRRGPPPKVPDDAPPPERQIDLTDPDSALMRRSDAHEYRQAYNAQAVVCADGTQLVLATNLVVTSADAPSFAATVLSMEKTIGLPSIVLADTGYASGPAVTALQARGVEPLVAIGRTQPHRPYDFRPPPANKTPRKITQPLRIAMKARLETDDGKTSTRNPSRPSNRYPA
jgi:hypothetical protein